MGFRIIIENYADAVKLVEVDPAAGIGPDESGEPIFFDVILDISGSMREFYDELVTCFNDIMIPALQGAAERYKGPMRLGCLLFSDELMPAWRGFKTLKELGPRPLQRAMLNQPGLKGGTSLYRAMRSGILWTAAAMERMYEDGEGESPKGKVIVLTDGANNQEPKDEAAVVGAFQSIGEQNQQAFRSFGRNDEGVEKNGLVIGYFETELGLTEDQFSAMAASTGFQGLGFYSIASGGTQKERQASFRHHFDIFSSKASE